MITIGIPKKCHECHYLSGIGFCKRCAKYVDDLDVSIYDKPPFCNLKTEYEVKQERDRIVDKKEWFRKTYLRENWKK